MEGATRDDSHLGMRTSEILRDPNFLRDVTMMHDLNPWVYSSSRFNHNRWSMDVDAPCVVSVLHFDWEGISSKLGSELKVLVLRQGAAGPLGSGQNISTCRQYAMGAIPLGLDAPVTKQAIGTPAWC